MFERHIKKIGIRKDNWQIGYISLLGSLFCKINFTIKFFYFGQLRLKMLRYKVLAIVYSGGGE